MTCVSGVLPNLEGLTISVMQSITTQVANEIIKFAAGGEYFTTISPDSAAAANDRRARYAKLAVLLDEWSAEPGDYDERVSAILEEKIHPGQLRFTERFE